MDDYTNYLAHHGVKGMKWGVRRKLRESRAGRYVSSHKKQIKNGARIGARVGLGAYAAKQAVDIARIGSSTAGEYKVLKGTGADKALLVMNGSRVAIKAGKAAVALAISHKLKNKKVSSVSSSTRSNGKAAVGRLSGS